MMRTAVYSLLAVAASACGGQTTSGDLTEDGDPSGSGARASGHPECPANRAQLNALAQLEAATDDLSADALDACNAIGTAIGLPEAARVDDACARLQEALPAALPEVDFVTRVQPFECWNDLEVARQCIESCIGAGGCRTVPSDEELCDGQLLDEACEVCDAPPLCDAVCNATGAGCMGGIDAASGCSKDSACADACRIQAQVAIHCSTPGVFVSGTSNAELAAALEANLGVALITLERTTRLSDAAGDLTRALATTVEDPADCQAAFTAERADARERLEAAFELLQQILDGFATSVNPIGMVE